MTIVKIEGKVEWKCFRAKGGNWVAICDPLSLTIQSETWATLMDDIAQTLNSILRDLMESQELHKFFQERGWRPMGPIPSRSADVSFDIPFIPRIADRDFQVALH
jgi:hypothetical protein